MTKVTTSVSIGSILALELIRDMCPNLVQFSIRTKDENEFTGAGVVKMLQGLRKLKRLSIIVTSDGCVDVELLGCLSKYCPDIEQLRLSYYPKGSFICKLPKIKYHIFGKYV